MRRHRRGIIAAMLASFFLLGLCASFEIFAKRVYRVGDFVPEENAYFAGSIDDPTGLIKARKTVTPSDTYYSLQKLYSHGSNMIGDIESVWSSYTGKGTTVAIIDDGFDYTHPEYTRSDGSSAILPASRHYYTDQNYTNIYYENYSDDPSCIGEDWEIDYNEWATHGTCTSTTAAAPMNNGGGVGIAPEADILAIKVDLSFISIYYAILYAVEQHVDVINMSVGAYAETFFDGWGDEQEGSSSVATYLNSPCQAAYNAGIIVVASAGNESTSHKSYPACNTKVIGVGALEENDENTLAAFTNYVGENQTGEINVDILAPGYVYTAEQGGTHDSPTHSYGQTQGTSFSSPIVAGAACLWKEKHPDGTPDEFLEDLQTSASDIGAYEDKMVPVSLWNKKLSDVGPSNITCGRLNVGGLLDIDEPFVDPLTENINITIGETKQIQIRSKNGAISYSSDNSSIATVSNTGLVTGVAAGSTNITVTAIKNLESTSVKIPVTISPIVAATSIAFDPSEVTLQVGETFDAEAALSVTPANASRIFLFDSGDDNVATVNEETGLVTAIGVGDTTIEAIAVNGVGYDVLTVHVEADDTPSTGTINFGSASGKTNITSTSVNGTDSLSNSWTITTSGTNSFTQSPDYSQIGSSKNPASSITFSMSLASTVNFTSVSASLGGFNDTSGSVTIKVGSTTIGTGSLSGTSDVNVTNSSTAIGNSLTISITGIAKGVKAYSISYTYSGSVVVPTVTSVSVSPSELNLDLNGNTSAALTASVVGTNNPAQTVTWTSSSTSIATVSNAGVVTAHSVGSATITATSTVDPSKSGTCSITVTDSTPVTLTSISVSGQRTQFEVGDDFEFGGTVTAHYSNSTTQNVTASASFSGYDMNSAGNQTVMVSYTESEIIRTTTYSIVISSTVGLATFTLGWGSATGQEGTYQNFIATSGNVSGILSFSSSQNSSINAPAYNSSNNELRLYYASGGDGCSITLTPAEGIVISQVFITATENYTPTLGYSIDGGARSTTSASNNAYTVSGFSAESSLKLQNANTSSTQLRIKTIAVSYRVDKEIASISASYTGEKLYVGDSLSKSDITVTATYTNSEKYPAAAIPASDFNISGYNSSSSGGKTVTVTYVGSTPTSTSPLTTTFSVQVYEDSIESVTFSSAKTFHPGETISKSDITATIHYESGKQEATEEFTLTEEGYAFTYADAPSGGSLGSKQFHAVFAAVPYEFEVSISRVAYVPISSSPLTVTGSKVRDAGVTGTGNSERDNYGSLLIDGVTYEAENVYVYNSTYISFGKDAGYIRNTTPLPSPISSLSISTGNSPRTDGILQVSLEGETYVSLNNANLEANDFHYFKLSYVGTSSNYSNVSTITIGQKGQDNLVNVANYVMYEDTENQCLSKLDVAVNRLNTMSAADKAAFWTSENYVIATARERLEAWARHQGKELTFESNSFAISGLRGEAMLRLSESSNDIALKILLGTSIAIVPILGGFLFLKHRKKEQ